MQHPIARLSAFRVRFPRGISRALLYLMFTPLVALGAPDTDFRSSNPTEIAIGVFALRGADKAKEMWNPTAEYLSQMTSGYRFHIVPLNNETIENAVNTKQVDFILTHPASYASLEAQYGISRLVTLKNERFGGAYTKFGALIFTRADRTDINTLADLRGKSFMGVHPNGFGGWWMAKRTLLQHNIDPDIEFKRLEFSGTPQDKVVLAVKQGQVDAGTVRTDILEYMASEGKISLSDFKVLDQKPVTREFPFVHSTELYPEWAFATLNHVSAKLAQDVAIALLKIPSTHNAALASQSAGWTIPLDYQAVHELMKELHVGPYKSLGEITLKKVIKKYAPWLTAVFIALTAMLIATIIVVRLNRKLKQSKNALEAEVIVRQQAEADKALYAKRLSDLYEITTMTSLNLEQQIKDTLELGCRTFNMEIGKICKIDTANNTSKVLQIVGPAALQLESGSILELHKSLCNVVFTINEPLAIDHMGKSFYKNHPIYESTKLEAYIGTTIWVNNKKHGTINFSSHLISKPFTQFDKDFINLIGRWVGVAMERQIAIQNERAREAAELANEAKRRFLTNMSHELRTPLNAIIGYSDILYEDLNERCNEQSMEDLKNIRAAGTHLLALIEDILNLSKLHSGNADVTIQKINLTHLADETREAYKIPAKNNNNRFTVTVRPGATELYSDYHKCRQILFSLVSNACKYTQDGEVNVSITEIKSKEQDWILFQVSDTGPGIAKQDQQDLFVEFVQFGDPGKPKNCSGLSLALGHKYCQLLGGDITVVSDLNIGSTFTMKLPKYSPADENIPHKSMHVA